MSQSDDWLDAFSPKKLGLTLNPEVVGPSPAHLRRKKPPNRFRTFIPAVPEDWARAAGALPGRSLQVALVAWRLAKMSKTLTISLSTKRLEPWGVDAGAKRRALAQLEKAGLIEVVEREPGRSPVITIKLWQGEPPPNSTPLL